ncbi:helix-turn-helix transcriptional regulator, partial [Escherichia coli]
KLTTISVTDVAYILHYSSHQNFCRAFKNYTSRTPTEYRKEEEWDFSIMQWTLTFSNEKETSYTLDKINEKYFSGDDIIVTDSLHQGGGQKLSSNIREIVESLW